MPSLVPPPQGMSASFRGREADDLGNLRNISGPYHGRRAHAIHLARELSGSVKTCAPPTISSRRVREACAGRLMRESSRKLAAVHADFSAGFSEWKHLAGIQQSGGIKRGANALHQVEIIRREHQRH